MSLMGLGPENAVVVLDTLYVYQKKKKRLSNANIMLFVLSTGF